MTDKISEKEREEENSVVIYEVYCLNTYEKEETLAGMVAWLGLIVEAQAGEILPEEEFKMRIIDKVGRHSRKYGPWESMYIAYCTAVKEEKPPTVAMTRKMAELSLEVKRTGRVLSKEEFTRAMEQEGERFKREGL